MACSHASRMAGHASCLLEPLESRQLLAADSFVMSHPVFSDVHGKATAVDAGNNIYLAGSFEGRIDFQIGKGKEIVKSSQETSFLAKFGPGGKLKWVNKLGATLDASQLQLAADPAGGVVVSAGLDGQDEGFQVSKYSKNGERKFRLNFDDGSSTAIAANDKGAVYLTGTYSGSFAAGGTTLTSAGAGRGSFLVKLTRSGNFGFAKNIGADVFLEARTITVNADRDVFVGGDAWDEQGNREGGVLKFNAKGTAKWYAPVGDGATLQRLAASPTGDLFAAGSFGASATFGDKTLAGAGHDDLFFAKLGPGGALRFAHGIGSSTVDRLGGIAVNAQGDLLITGSFASSFDFDPRAQRSKRLGARGGDDAFLARYASSGKLDWVRRLGTIQTDSIANVTVDSDNSIVVTGHLGDDLELKSIQPKDAEQTPVADQGLYLIKLKPKGRL